MRHSSYYLNIVLSFILIAHSEEKEIDDLSDCCSNWSEKCAAIRIDCGKNKEPGKQSSKSVHSLKMIYRFWQSSLK